MRLVDAHITAQERLRRLVANGVERTWTDLGAWNEPDAERFIATVVPFVRASQKQSVMLTNAYVAKYLGRRPTALDPRLLDTLRAGVPADEVYHRPFVTVWTALKAGTRFEDAVNAGLARATSTAAMDVQLASRATFTALEQADDAIYGYQRVADAGACDYCQAIDGAYVKSADAMALHNHCGCSLEPLTAPRGQSPLPDTVAVHEHGELGPVLGAPEHNFTSLAEFRA